MHILHNLQSTVHQEEAVGNSHRIAKKVKNKAIGASAQNWRRLAFEEELVVVDNPRLISTII